jgi:hypothetical protein
MLFDKNLWLIILGGLMNGSFVIPMRYIKANSSENIWLHHSIIGLALIPWLLLIMVYAGEIPDYTHLAGMDWLFLLGGGLFLV